jgi:DNA primase
MPNYTSFAQKNFDIANTSGDEFTVRCVFHDDSSPSMQFNTRSGLYICWSCGAKGNIEHLQKHLGVIGYDNSPDLDDLRRKIKEIHDQETSLVSVLPEHTLKRYRFPTDYWTVKRGFSDDVIRLFQLGYDPMENHAIIPVRDYRSQLISVIRRDLDPRAMIRYRNGKKFPRKSTLFGAWLAAKHPTDRVVVCEGPLDAISVWSAGIPAVAQFGSSMSNEQKMILMQLGVTKVVLFYDNDRSGRGATQQAYELLRGEFLVHRVMYRKSDGKDPGEMSHMKLGSWGKAMTVPGSLTTLRCGKNACVF